MPSNVVVRLRADSPALTAGLACIATELELPGDFPAEVLAAAEQAAATVVLPELDRTDLPLVTIDPPGAMDLDQALHIARTEAPGGGVAGGGYVVHYAIADVAAFVEPGGPIDVEAHRRGETLYGVGDRIPLHPPTLSEGAASLLPGQVRPALLWTHELDAGGALARTRVERARVRSTARWSYAEAQAALDDGTADEVLRLLREVGTLRHDAERARGGVSLPLPEQEVEESGDGLRLTFRESLPVEEWNAQVSLLTGIAAASLMVRGRIGLLRTLPPAEAADVQRLRRVARGLGIAWPAEQDYAAFVASLDPAQPAHQAMVVACTRLLRGSGYAAFDGELPAQTRHSAIAEEYAHVTAPLRRLGDRYAGEVCLALCAGEPVPAWVRAALPELPKTLQSSARRAGAYERAVLDLVEAAVLAGRVGEHFAGVVTSVRDNDPTAGVVVLSELGVEAPVTADRPLPLGDDVTVTLAEVDLAARRVAFRLGES
ncbi:RNB domain-containing ribonuclease [Nocardioides faecalis]|uniref:RNB domain-containing ribonuclease n=1 Tax=Nocardioides faecalis TaxID=2803858 RepID=UPI0027DD170F|nr:RNB domain-containing ribonuclease [Nocardioides faecalis]